MRISNISVENEFSELKITPPADNEERNARLEAVYAAILANPQHWNQEHWHCGTTHCFAGFAQLMAYGLPVTADVRFQGDESSPLVPFDRPEREVDPELLTTAYLRAVNGADAYLGALSDAREYLGLTFEQCEKLFFANNSLAAIRRYIDEIKAS